MCSALYLKRTHKFGHELPKMVNDAYPIEKKKKNTLWQDTIQKEMENVKIANPNYMYVEGQLAKQMLEVLHMVLKYIIVP